jgi:hypothetical protein
MNCFAVHGRFSTIKQQEESMLRRLSQKAKNRLKLLGTAPLGIYLFTDSVGFNCFLTNEGDLT